MSLESPAGRKQTRIACNCNMETSVEDIMQRDPQFFFFYKSTSAPFNSFLQANDTGLTNGKAGAWMKGRRQGLPGYLGRRSFSDGRGKEFGQLCHFRQGRSIGPEKEGDEKRGQLL